jgi:ATP-dependent DNA ligase
MPLLVRPKAFSALPPAKVRFIEPMYARLVQSLPHGQDWLYEVKFDGYRCFAGRGSTGVTLWSRRGNLFTNQFPHIARACERLPPGTLVDGEIVALGENGRISFNLLQHHRSKAQALLFYVFDVLVHRGRSFLMEPLERRRQVLAEAIKGNAAPIALSETLDASADELVRVAKEFGFEGIIAKRKDSGYESGKRTGAWVKYKVNQGQEFVIGGYTPGNPFDALIVGYYEGERLLYAAKVRNGFVPQHSPGSGEKVQGARNPYLPVRQPTRKEAHSMGFDQGRNEKLRMAQTGAGRTGRVHRMDAGWSPEAFEVCRG